MIAESFGVATATHSAISAEITRAHAVFNG
jgi:hypothetical protein